MHAVFVFGEFSHYGDKRIWKNLEHSVFLVKIRKRFKKKKIRKEKTLVEACSKYFTFVFSL
jgi:hypothetical protein